MITEKQKQIIRLLLTSKEGYNVNQIARILNISVSWCHETLKILERDGILSSVKIANSILFKINWQNPKAVKLCDFVIIDEETKYRNDNKDSEKLVIKNVTSYGFAPVSKTQDNAYSLGSNSALKPNIDDPYRQAVTLQNSRNFSYAPVGEQGVNNVLFSYASSGAFGNPSPYSSASVYSSSPVPPNSLGARVSGNTSGFTLPMHTANHMNNNVDGCRYCGPEPKLPF
ncbi:winged helix-turn-helix transcriptional regulator [Candidatus Woesearchaeota archaeon]|nr:winged helix-turn-helix transcriptional regulator [Candidatus Woesearchaeota archaeon]